MTIDADRGAPVVHQLVGLAPELLGGIFAAFFTDSKSRCSHAVTCGTVNDIAFNDWRSSSGNLERMSRAPKHLATLDVAGDQAFLREENNLPLTVNVRHDRAGVSHLIAFSAPYRLA